VDLEISTQSRPYIKVPVTAKLAGVVLNPTSDVVQMAFSLVGSDPSTWYAAVWETDSTTTPPTYLARILVGPGGATGALALGTYNIWVKVTDNPEIPVLRSSRRLKII
jgi:hypothetical protein